MVFINFLTYIYYLVYPKPDNYDKCDDLIWSDKFYFMTVGIHISLTLGIFLSLIFYQSNSNVKKGYSSILSDESSPVDTTGSGGGRRRIRKSK